MNFSVKNSKIYFKTRYRKRIPKYYQNRYSQMTRPLGCLQRNGRKVGNFGDILGAILGHFCAIFQCGNFDIFREINFSLKLKLEKLPIPTILETKNSENWKLQHKNWQFFAKIKVFRFKNCQFFNFEVSNLLDIIFLPI